MLQKDEGLGRRVAVLGNQVVAGGLQLVQVAQLAVVCKPEAGWIRLKEK